MLELTIKANSLGELHTQIASMSAELAGGAAPVVTKEVTQAKEPTKTTSPAPQETTPPTTEEEAPTEQLEDLIPKLQEVARGLITSGKSADVKAILGSVGASALSKIPLDRQAEVLASMELL